MYRNYVLDVKSKDEELAVEVLEQFVARGDIEVVSREKIRHGDDAVSCFYMRCSTDDLEDVKKTLIERGVELV